MRKSYNKKDKKRLSRTISENKLSSDKLNRSKSIEFILNDINQKEMRLAAVRRFTTNPFSLNLEDAEDLLNEDYYEQ